jgi:thiol-disulfide isomerase/thioredoxin
MTQLLMRRTSAALVAALLLALAACSDGSAASVPDQGFVSGDGTVSHLPLGERTDPVRISGTSLGGKQVRLQDLRGQVVVLNVWGSWCAPCIAEAPALEAAYEQTKADGVAFLGINTKDDAASARAHERRFDVTYPSIDDDGGRVLLSLRGKLPPLSVPSTVVLDRRGRVAARVIGPVDRSVLVGLVQDVVAEPQA